MNPDEVLRTLSELSDVEATTADQVIRVFVGAVGDGFHLSCDEIAEVKRIFSPMGDLAFQFRLRRGGDETHLIVTNTDIVFPPAPSDGILDSPIPVVVEDAPHLIAYSELVRDVEGVARASEGDEANLASLAGAYLLLRCCIMGAVAFGMHPVTAVGWWERGWSTIGDDLPLPPFRSDPTWERLAQDAAQISVSPSPAMQAPTHRTRDVTRADFEAVGHVMSVTRLDDEFLSAWNSWIPIDPAMFVEALTDGLSGASFDVTLYPEGAGSVDLRLHAGDVLSGLLQLRFSFADETMYLDEIRIAESARGSGRFQRLVFNTEVLATRLGLAQVRFLATGIGGYALAKVGRYPQ